MTTLAVMKSRIASEVRRSDLTQQIDSAIKTAIAAYQHERFGFSESRDITFSTVLNQEIYSASSVPELALVRKIDNVHVSVSDASIPLEHISQERIEFLSQNGTQAGDPLYYSWFARQFRIYPVPAQVSTVRIAGHAHVAAPATDDEAANPWMTDAERLIRSRAKYELAIHVLLDDKLGQMMSDAVLEAENQLLVLANREQVPRWTIEATRF